jgi:CheY-like chemotaxis protein
MARTPSFPSAVPLEQFPRIGRPAFALTYVERDHFLRHPSASRTERRNWREGYSCYTPASPQTEFETRAFMTRALSRNAGPQGLIVDAEARSRTLATTVLAKEGYTVRATDDPLEALWMAISSRPAPDFLVTECVFNSISGLPLVIDVREKCPFIRILLTSKYDPRRWLAPGLVDAYLAKPFTATRLCIAVRQLLDENPTSASEST